MVNMSDYFKEFNLKKWFDFNKGLSDGEIKKKGSKIKVIGIEELMDFLYGLKEGSRDYAALDKRQMLFPMKYYLDYDFPSDAFVTLANTINIPYFSREEREKLGSPQKIFLENYKEYTTKAKERIEKDGSPLFDTKHFNEYFCTRGFKYMSSTSTHKIISENHLVRGWLLFSILSKLSEKGIFCIEYSTAGGNFYMRIPSTSYDKHENLEEILNGENRKEVITRNYVVGEENIGEWHLLHAKVEDRGEVFRGKKSKYRIAEEFINHSSIATMIFRQFVYKVLNGEEQLKKENFEIRDYAKKPTKMQKVFYNLIPIPTKEAIELYSKLINRVVIPGRENPKLGIREIESIFSAVNKRMFLEGRDVYSQNDSYENLVSFRDMILEETLKWSLE